MGRAFSSSYLAGEPAAHAFFAPRFRDPAERIARARLAAEASTPPVLLQVLREQQTTLPPSVARQANLAALAKGKTAVVATGQQIGLFLGPLYAFYKAASAIAVARAIEAESGVRCVPLFWLQTEDHDFEEIRACVVAGGEGEPARLVLADEDGDARASVAYRTLPVQVSELLDTLVEALEPGPAAEQTLALLRAHYQPGQSMAGAFASVMAAVFAEEGLLVFNPRDARVAELAAPIYRTCLDDCEAIEHRLQDRGNALAAAGFKEQVAVRERGALIFFHRDSARGPRFRIQRKSASSGEPTWALAGSPEVVRQQDMLRTLAADPLRFSTSALLRPIVQDTLLPTVAYVGGPGEINYFAQVSPLYAHFGLQPPLLVPRARFRCVDARTRRRLGQLGLAAADLSTPKDELRARLTVTPPEGAAHPQELRAIVASQVVPALERIAASVEAVDVHLQRAARRTRASVGRGLERLIARYARTLVERDETTMRRIHQLEMALNPDGIAQERFYSWPSLAGRLGVAELKRLVLEKLQSAGAFVTEVLELQP
ncbi:MAG TPA: bacillithiol biosynthesis cysteine-adding enzyme BshC [Polyangia bacterium]